MIYTRAGKTVIVVVMAAKRTRQLLIQAQKRGMCNGDFAFFGLDALREDILDPKGWLTDVDGEALQTPKNLCQTFFVMALRFSKNDPNFKAFAKRVLARARLKSGSSAPEVNYFSATFHDAGKCTDTSFFP